MSYDGKVGTASPELVDGKETGQMTYQFKADGFGPNCDPNRKPSFDIRNPRPKPKPTQ